MLCESYMNVSMNKLVFFIVNGWILLVNAHEFIMKAFEECNNILNKVKNFYVEKNVVYIQIYSAIYVLRKSHNYKNHM